MIIFCKYQAKLHVFIVVNKNYKLVFPGQAKKNLNVYQYDVENESTLLIRDKLCRNTKRPYQLKKNKELP